MKEPRPDWYDIMKTEPFTRKTFTLNHITKIEKAAEAGMVRSIWKRIGGVSTLFTVIVCASLLLLMFLQFDRQPAERALGGGEQSQPPIGTPSPNDKVVDDKGNLIAIDRNWLIPRDTFTLYQSYSKSRSEERLKGVKPLDIFRMYVLASQNGDNETMYALLIKGSEYGTPSLEEYLADIANDPELRKRSTTQWTDWKKTYRLQEEVNGDEAIIRMTPHMNAAGPIAEDEKFFRLIKNNDGIWKVGWLAMQ